MAKDHSGIRAEFAGVNLGDERRLERLLDVVALMARAPRSSYAGMCSTEAEREGLYRLVRNGHFEWEALLEGHLAESVARAHKAQRVLVIHDTTDVQVPDEAELESYLSAKKKGFLAHASLIVHGTKDRHPLGLGALEIVERPKGKSRTKRNGRRMTGNETARLKNKEYDRWARAVAKTEEALQGVGQIVHVMDAEGDSYPLMTAMAEAEQQFVIRMSHDRCAKGVGEGAEWLHLRELLESATTFKRTREVHVSKRRGRRAPDAAKARPARDARTAELTFAFTTALMKRPSYVKLGAPEMQVSVVRAYEKSPPPGAEPIDWVLLTTLSVRSKAEAMQIVDIYRQRWLIEEFFKALKTGCQFGKRNLTSPHSIYNSLAILAPIAWRGLLLRQLARVDSARASEVLSPRELRVLLAKAKHLRVSLPAHPSAEQALLFIAQLGGHRTSNGPPGWEIVMRGLQKLDDLLAGWTLREASEM